ncbi:hypothetical protein B0H14DRAFT_2969661 [Mycena olivaceomarginata]|nr:hypothetical protein B0H14DRAFT_2969661 [Mycena olivaceomarginata]
MSARQPFVPGGFPLSSRPESRAAQANNAGNTAMSTSLHFVADPSNPLNGGPTASNAQKDQNAESRPLNISSLTKANRSQNNAPSRRQSIQTTARPSTSDPKSMPAPNHIARPGTSDPHSKSKLNIVPNHRLQAHANSHGIVAPTPLQARSATALFSSSSSSSFPSAFKTPALPGSRLSPQQHPSTDAHAHTRAHGFHPSANEQLTEQQQPSPEQSQENTDSPLRLKTLPSQPGPHRLVFAARTDLVEDDEIFEVSEADVAVRNASGRKKRGRSEVEDDDDEHAHIGYGGQAKRFKAQQADENTYRRPSSDANEMYHRSSSPHDVQEYPPPQQPRRQSASSRGGNHPVPGASRFPPQYANANPAQSPAASSGHGAEIGRLVHLLKADDFDLACDERVEKYTRMAERWKGCTRDEWMAGAEELTAVYTKIFDFVKAHMAAKIKVFASCEGKLQQQGQVLKDRDLLLADVKDRVVAESGNVLGK